MRVNILIKDCAGESAFNRLLWGRWWWHVETTGGARYAWRSGFARSEESARQQAERAAKNLRPVPETRYTLEV